MYKVVILLALLCAGCTNATQQDETVASIGDTEKKEFLEMMKTLPTTGEFFAEAGIKQAAPHIAVLFSLTKDDLKEFDMYPFAVLSRGLCDEKKHQLYAKNHFQNINHPTIKLLWGSMLLNEEVRDGSLRCDICEIFVDT